MSTRIVDAHAGQVEVTPKRKQVAIVGFADSTRDLAPNADPAWELWSLNQVYRHVARWTDPALQDRNEYPIRHFEIHLRSIFEADMVRDTDYLGWLTRCPVPIYMVERDPQFPNSVRYPLEAVTARFPGPHPLTPAYHQSTISYQVALALLEGFEEIAIYGVDLVVGEEYSYQKPNLEWWLGLAQGMGVKITLPTGSALTKALYCYGRQPGPNFWPIDRPMLQSRYETFMTERNRLLTQINAVEGAAQAMKELLHILELTERGSTVFAPPPSGQLVAST